MSLVCQDMPPPRGGPLRTGWAKGSTLRTIVIWTVSLMTAWGGSPEMDHGGFFDMGHREAPPRRAPSAPGLGAPEQPVHLGEWGEAAALAATDRLTDRFLLTRCPTHPEASPPPCATRGRLTLKQSPSGSSEKIARELGYRSNSRSHGSWGEKHRRL